MHKIFVVYWTSHQNWLSNHYFNTKVQG